MPPAVGSARGFFCNYSAFLEPMAKSLAKESNLEVPNFLVFYWYTPRDLNPEPTD